MLLTAASRVEVEFVSQGGTFNSLAGISNPVVADLFACHDVAPGFSVDLGIFASGELQLTLATPEGFTYSTGPGSRNPDGLVHASLQSQSPSSVRVSWEDLFGGGDMDFNDCVVQVNATAVSG